MDDELMKEAKGIAAASYVSLWPVVSRTSVLNASSYQSPRPATRVVRASTWTIRTD